MICHDLARLSIHTMTNRPWSLAECVDYYTQAGIPALSVWRNVIDPDEGGMGIAHAARLLHGSGLHVPALVRGGFFPAREQTERAKILDSNRQYIDEAAALAADMLVLVVGAVPGMPLEEARKQVADAVGALVPHAESCGIKLAIEPMHPMYAAEWSCINRLREAREICESLKHPLVGMAIDVYHVWFDPDLQTEIQAAGSQGFLFGYHINDWRVDTQRIQGERGLMGDGCIDLPAFQIMIEAAGFTGFHEVEVFSDQYWNSDQAAYLELILTRYRELLSAVSEQSSKEIH